MSWRNDDGLLVKFGTEKATAQNGGAFRTSDGKLVWEFDIDLLDAGLSTTDAQVVNTDNLFIPTGVHIEKVIVNVMEVPTGADANLDLGLCYYLHAAAGTLTEKDYNGLLAAADFGDFGATGDIHEYTRGSTEYGALIGTTITTTTESGFPDHDRFYFSYSEDTAAFTAGALKVRVIGHIPSGVGF